jgi:alpha-mannosidase
MDSLTDSLTDAIAHLRSLTQLSIQSQWHFCQEDLPVEQALMADWSTWAIAPLNDRAHIAWPKGRQVMWLGQRWLLPQDLRGYSLAGLSLRLSLTWWAESAEIFVNGDRVQAGDLFDHSARVLLSQAVQPGEAILPGRGSAIGVAIRLVSPGHDDGALVKSICVYERENQPDCPEPGFVADELAVLQRYVTQFVPERLGELVGAIDPICEILNDLNEKGMSHAPDGPLNPPFWGTLKLDQALVTLRQQLLPWSEWMKGRSLQLVGHAHLDLAWLWDVAETWNAAERTFRSVLQLQQDFPELTFCHSSPALYAWVEANRPELWAAIRQQVAAGRWEIVAGLWVEPELNLVSGESLVRQVLYGQRYVKEKFGQVSPIAWLPDSFGFCWQLPQILRQGGVQYFVTQKLRWNDSTQFPYEFFQWRSPDRTSIFSLNTAPIGEGIDPVKMADYACEWEARTGVTQALWLPGVGDHGGGPTRDMLTVAQRWQRSPFFPKLEFGTVLDFLQSLEAIESPPMWSEDLYLEFHRGCYTTHADQKRRNRRCEELLYEAELFGAIAHLVSPHPYPQAAIETAWKHVLFNQFHDILPGSAIPEVYRDADEDWVAAELAGAEIKAAALAAIAAEIQLRPPHPEAEAIVVFNALNWERSGLLQVGVPEGDWQVCDESGERLPLQSQEGRSISFSTAPVPGIGYRCFWLCPGQAQGSSINQFPDENKFPDENILENEFLRVTINPQTGNLASVFDKVQQRQVLSGEGNQLQAFRDAGQYWDAWNIDPHYAEHPLPVTLKAVHPAVHNELQSQIRVERAIGQSVFRQTYCLERHSPLLKISTEVDWQERHVLVKAAFPLNLEVDTATYEIPCGAIERTTRPETDRQKAQWEVPALRWTDLSSEDYGVSLLNDCKYGYDAEPSQIRLTLLRGAEWPNPEADLGVHAFTYALYPHGGDWRSGSTVRQGYELNQPLTLLKISPKTSGHLPMTGQFLNLEANNLVLMAFKRSEDAPDQWIVRCYEAEGRSADLQPQDIPGLLPLGLGEAVNLLEEPVHPGGEAIAPWKISSYRFSRT